MLSSDLLIRHPTREDITISPVDIPGWPQGYNMGDLLNAPLLRGPRRRGAARGIHKGQRLVTQHMPRSVVSRYLTAVGEAFWDKAPNRTVLLQVLTERNLISGQLEEIERLVRSETTLVVHLRIGDKGTRHSADAKRCLLEHAHPFELVILLFGLHARHRLYDDQGQNHRETSLEAIREMLHDVPNARLLVEGSPDQHLYLMHKARHLLLTFGGFSELGALVCQGKMRWARPGRWRGTGKTFRLW